MAGLALSVRLLLLAFVLAGTAAEKEPSLGREERDLGDKTTKKIWKTVGILTSPYMMIHNDSGKLEYKGFIPDLLNEMSRHLDITFDIYSVPDGHYGSFDNNTGLWNGMIKEVINRKADLAAAPLTITAHRKRVVHFVKPFLHNGFSILLKKRGTGKVPGIFSGYHMFYNIDIFLPIGIFISMLLVSLVLWLMNRFNPYEFGRQYINGRATKQESEIFTYAGALWFTFSILQCQGFEKSPRSLASRVLCCVWFMFVILTLLTYLSSLTGNMLIYLPNRPVHTSPIESLDDLIGQTRLSFGAVDSGSAHTYLNQIAERNNVLRKYLQSQRSKRNMVKSNEEGLRLLRHGWGYAFITEALTAEYETQRRPCDVVMAGEPFGGSSMGMALPRNVDRDTLEALDAAVLKLQESGYLERLRRKWWYDMGECGLSQVRKYKPTWRDAPYVDVRTAWPLICILAVGLLATLITTLVEVLHFRLKGKMQEAAEAQGGLQLQDELAQGEIT